MKKMIAVVFVLLLGSVLWRLSRSAQQNPCPELHLRSGYQDFRIKQSMDNEYTNGPEPLTVTITTGGA
jgi:hypothetical protein